MQIPETIEEASGFLLNVLEPVSVTGGVRIGNEVVSPEQAQLLQFIT